MGVGIKSHIALDLRWCTMQDVATGVADVSSPIVNRVLCKQVKSYLPQIHTALQGAGFWQHAHQQNKFVEGFTIIEWVGKVWDE